MKTTRRQFLSASALAAATLGSGAIARAASRTSAAPVRLAIATYSYWHFRPPKVSIETVIDKAAQLGVEGVDVLHRQMDSEEPAYVRKLKRHALSRGVALNRRLDAMERNRVAALTSAPAEGDGEPVI